MTTFNFREACLLDVSGELSPAARRQFLAYLRENPSAWAEYEDIRARIAILDHLALVEPSAAERSAVPARIKASIRRELMAQERARRDAARWTLARHVLTGVASVAAVLVITLSIIGPRTTARAPQTPAQVEVAQHYLNSFGTKPATPFELAVNDVESSIRDLQTESPAIAGVQTTDMADLLDALAAVPEDFDDRALTEPLGSPGSL